MKKIKAKINKVNDRFNFLQCLELRSIKFSF